MGVLFCLMFKYPEIRLSGCPAHQLYLDVPGYNFLLKII